MLGSDRSSDFDVAFFYQWSLKEHKRRRFRLGL